MRYDLPIDENTVSSAIIFATAAAGCFPSVGGAGVVSVSVKTVWKKIYGACPVMPSPGNARTVEGKMDLVTSESPRLCGDAEYEQIFSNIRI
jgi:hypothetical protein